jgi:hypothetical protein
MKENPPKYPERENRKRQCFGKYENFKLDIYMYRWKIRSDTAVFKRNWAPIFGFKPIFALANWACPADCDESVPAHEIFLVVNIKQT